jgi:lipoprotein-anchoring transpeptidase ErfK/SrfK
VDPVTVPSKASDRADAEHTDPPEPTPSSERSSEPADPGTDGPPATDGAVVHAYAAKPRHRLVDIYREPGSVQPRYAFDVENPFGQRAPLLVERGMRDAEGERWVRVQLPIRPNGTTGWVRVDQVRLLPRDELIVVDLSERRLRHYVAGRLTHVFRVGIGRPDAPSARGLFSVWARVPQTDGGGPYGTFVLGLSGLAPISEWTGQGRMAIHGTADPADRGRRVSSGCVRVFNPQVERLTGVPLGTPVVIRA